MKILYELLQNICRMSYLPIQNHFRVTIPFFFKSNEEYLNSLAVYHSFFI